MSWLVQRIERLLWLEHSVRQGKEKLGNEVDRCQIAWDSCHGKGVWTFNTYNYEGSKTLRYVQCYRNKNEESEMQV